MNGERTCLCFLTLQQVVSNHVGRMLVLSGWEKELAA